LPLRAALHRERRELGLRLVAADDEHQDVLAARLVVGHVHEAPRHAHRQRDDVERPEVHVLHRRALVPLAAPAPADRDEGLVRVVVVHERSLAGLRLAVAEVEALGDRDRGHRRGILAHRRGHGVADRAGRLEPDDGIQRPAAFRQGTVGQAAVGTFQPAEARDALEHFLAGPVADLLPVVHGSFLFLLS
jgi:hypothetical protein